MRARRCHASLAFTLAAVVRLFPVCASVGGETPPFLVLAEFAAHISIHNISLNAPSRTSHVACQGDTMVLFLSPHERASTLAGRKGNHELGLISQDEAIELGFGVRNLIMGQAAGRAAVLVDDETVAECPAERCRVRLSTSQVLADKSRGKDETPRTHRVQISLIAPEADMTAQAVMLGVQCHFSLALVPTEDISMASAELEASSGPVIRVKPVRQGELISMPYCTGNRFGEGKGAEEEGVVCDSLEATRHPEDGHGYSERMREDIGNKQVRSLTATEGESNEAQHLFIRSLVLLYTDVRDVLEIGFHAGLSARAFLSARDNIKMVSFDIGRHGHEVGALRKEE